MSEPSSATPSSASQEPSGPSLPTSGEPAAPDVPAPVQVRLRRAPRYRAFVLLGAVLGVIAGVVASLLLADPGYRFSLGTTTGYLAAIGLLLGGLLGGTVAVLVERSPR